MSWAKLDDSIYDNPKMVGLSDRAFRTYINALAYASRHLTDGHVPALQVPTLRGTPRVVQELVEADLWSANGFGFVINDYLVYNPSRAVVEERRRKNADKLAKYRAKEAEEEARNHDA